MKKSVRTSKQLFIVTTALTRFLWLPWNSTVLCRQEKEVRKKFGKWEDCYSEERSKAISGRGEDGTAQQSCHPYSSLLSLRYTLTLKCYLQSSRTWINILNFLQSELKFPQFFPNFQHAKLKILLHFIEHMILFYLLHMLVHRQFRIKFQCDSNINLTFQARM